MTSPLEKVRNLGPKSSLWLERIGIDSLTTLKKKGVVNAYIKLKVIMPQVSLNMLYAIQAALWDMSLHQLPLEIKNDLKRQLAQAEKEKSDPN